MAYQKLSPTDLVAAVQKKIKERTDLQCYDHVPLNEDGPFYYAELVQIRPANTKTMFRDIYTVYVHCIAEESPSSVGVYNLIEKLQEAMTEDISLPEPFDLVMQTDMGVQTIKTDDTGEKHAVVGYEIMVCYGFMCKI